ncbi:hypothetical protein CLIB1444_10S02124 [[Candida] jaroonii]|uniref:Uncharacterized protein n=1 Tax=[Candida] jaroonii TaxID=467808 RepID=A0ACA9YC10_9ASCO|nr:hypothetical protein CLIB1444_10S02124 [[Candida] jaroonii]
MSENNNEGPTGSRSLDQSSGRITTSEIPPQSGGDASVSTGSNNNGNSAQLQEVQVETHSSSNDVVDSTTRDETTPSIPPSVNSADVQAGQQSATTTVPQTTPQPTPRSTTPTADLPPTTNPTGGEQSSLEDNLRNFFQDELTRANDTRQDSAAIVISINYVFSDENNPSNPNRSGILTLTLPNSASNRDPRVLQEFIRLATQMAYATIINNNNGGNKGVTIDKFNSFKHLTAGEINDTQCSICLETFEADNFNVELINNKINDDVVSNKKRKLNDSSSVISEPTTEERKKYLSELTTEFPHIPIEMPCKHIFGKSCLCEWLKNHSTCPLCRKAIEDPEATADSGEDNSNNIRENILRMGENRWNVDGSNVMAISGTEFDEIFNNFRANLNPSTTTTSTTPSTTSSTTSTTQEPRNNTTENDRSTLVSFGRRIISRPSNVFSYIRRRPQNDMFASGVESRRTASGVVTNTIPSNPAPESLPSSVPPPPPTTQLFRIFPEDNTAQSTPTTRPQDAANNDEASENTGDDRPRTNSNSLTDEILDYLNLRNLQE